MKLSVSTTFLLCTLYCDTVHVNAFTTTKKPQCNIVHQRAIGQSSLLMAKDSYRARVDQKLEDMMGDDWRYFRARLVAQENAEAEKSRKQVIQRLEQSVIMDAPSLSGDGCENKHLKLSHIFWAFISSVFSQNKRHERRHEIRDSSIFDGDTIGGATPHSQLPFHIEDPFASEAEIVAIRPPSVMVDKHRWAHPISHIEPGCVLIASERLGGVFRQAVVLIVDHNEATGSTGVVINRPIQGNLLKVASETASNVDLSLKLAFNCATVSYGGPVMQEDYSIIHGYGEVEGSKKIAPGLFVGGSRELMNEVRRNNFDPHMALFVKGHAAWVPSQLTREISKGVWYTACISPDLILHYAKAPNEKPSEDNLWLDVLMCMGGRYEETALKQAAKIKKEIFP